MQDASGMGTHSCASCHHAAGFRCAAGPGDGGRSASVERVEISQDYAPNEIDRQPMRSPTAMNGAFTPCHPLNGQFGAHGPNVGTESNWTEGTPIATNLLGYMGLGTQAIAGLTVHRMALTAHFFDSPVTCPCLTRPFPNFRSKSGTASRRPVSRSPPSNAQSWGMGPRSRNGGGQHTAMTTAQKEGDGLLRRRKCGTCHNGPGLTDGGFRAWPDMLDIPRSTPDSRIKDCPGPISRWDGRFTGQDGDKHAFKTPQPHNPGTALSTVTEAPSTHSKRSLLTRSTVSLPNLRQNRICQRISSL